MSSATTIPPTELPAPHPPPIISPSRLTVPLPPPPKTRPLPLGHGTFGLVYPALLDRACPVAIKLLKPPPTSYSTLPSPLSAPSRHSAIARHQFDIEIRRYNALHGVPGVARFYGVAAHESPVSLFVIERLSGGSLRQVLKSGGLDARGALRVAHVVANALAGIHARGFSHGDVKPEHVLFGEQVTDVLDDTVDVRLVDFGLSRSFQHGDEEDDEDHLRSDADDTAQGRAASILGPMEARGTPAYLAPEAWGGRHELRKKRVAQAADVYALAMLMYELEAIRVPWVGLRELGALDAVVNNAERPPWPSSRERVPGFRELVERCWTQEYTSRPSAAQVAAELARLRAAQGYAGGDMGLADRPVDAHYHGREGGGGEVLPLLSLIDRLAVDGEADSGDGKCGHGGEEAPGDDAMGAAYGGRDIAVTAEVGHANRGTDRGVGREEESGEGVVGSRQPGGVAATTHPVSSPRQQSGGLSMDGSSMNGGYEADGVSQVNPQHSDRTMGSSRSAYSMDVPDTAAGEDAGAHAQPEADSAASQFTVPDGVRNSDYAFKELVVRNDTYGLYRALAESHRQPEQAAQVLEAITVLISKGVENCEHFVDIGGLHRLATVLSRFGSRGSPRLSKAACFLVANMALCDSKVVKMELKKTGVCNIVLNAFDAYPSKAVVVQNAAAALVHLCRSSPDMCSIVLELGGIDYALRVVDRALRSFNEDAWVASDGLVVISILATSHPKSVAQKEVISKVLKACDEFRNEKIDEHSLSILRHVTREETGREAILSVTDNMPSLSRLIDRLASTGTSHASLRELCQIMSALALEPNRAEARNAFLASTAVESVVQAVRSCAEPDVQGVEPTVLGRDSTTLAIVGIQCFSSMASLGRDVCGSLQMAQVFDVTQSVLKLHPTNRAMAMNAAKFLESILNELRTSTFGPYLDVVRELLVQLEQRWRGDPSILDHVGEAKRLLREASGRDQNADSSDSFEVRYSRSHRNLFGLKRSAKGR